MADTVTLPLTGTGDATAIVATDDAGAAGQVQIVKLAIATDGSATAIPADATDGILVNLGANNDVTVSGVSTAAKQDTGNTSLATLAGAVAGTEVQVDVLTMPSTTVTATDLDIRNLVFATDKIDVSGSTLAANSGVDIGDVTINNAAGAAAVNIQDGGNAITVDGSLTAVTTVTTVTTVSTVTAVTTITNPVTIAGGAAHGSPVSGNPNLVAGRASNAIPTDVGADGDAASMWTNRNGAQVVSRAPHVGLNSDPWSLVHEGVQYTAAQTSAVVITGGASEKIVVTQVQIQAFDATAGTAILYFGTGAYSRGTNRAIFDGEFAPSSTLKPGVVLTGPFIAGTNGDDLLFTSVGDIDVTISVWYYVVT